MTQHDFHSRARRAGVDRANSALVYVASESREIPRFSLTEKAQKLLDDARVGYRLTPAAEALLSRGRGR